MKAVKELSLCLGIVEGTQNATNPVLSGALTTKAMDVGKSATESLNTRQSVYEVNWNTSTKEHHHNIKVFD